MRLRSIAIGMTLLVTGTIVGTATQQLVTASTSSGDRPVLIPVTPCRLVDTRSAPNTVGPRSAPLAAIDTMTVDAQEPGTDCSGVIPGDASALSLNITALNATAVSFLTIWPGGDRPLAASLNPAPGQPPVPNAVTTELSVDQEFQIYNNAGSVNVVIDVNGFYVDHDHDDRYYTRTQADAQFADQSDTYTKGQIDDGFVAAPTSIDLSSAAFAPIDGGWDLGPFSIARVYSFDDRTCAVADIELPAGAVVRRVDVTYANFAFLVDADLDISVDELRAVNGQVTGGDRVAAASIVLPYYGDDFSSALAGADVVDATPAADNAAHQLKMCSSDRSITISSVHLTL